MDDLLLLFFGGHPKELIAAEEDRFTEPINQLDSAQLLLNGLPKRQIIKVTQYKT